MEKRAVGPQASAIKYDILSALLVMAAQGDPTTSRLATRLALIITARFNWRKGSFVVAQREMARMWGVTERTAKREMALLRQRGWVNVLVPAARGRIAEHRINFDTIVGLSRPFWDSIGPDYAARMGQGQVPVETESNVVPLVSKSATIDISDPIWATAVPRLLAEDEGIYHSWFAPLEPLGLNAHVYTLAAPTNFVANYVRSHFLHRLLGSLSAADPAVRDVAVVVLPSR